MRLETRSRRAARISLTPLIDVVFILLLFFMLTTRFAQQQAMTLELPGTRSAVESAADSVSLRLANDGSVQTSAGQRVATSALRTHPAILRLLAEDLPVRIDVDDDVTLQLLVRTLDLFESMGLRRVTVRELHR